METINSFTNSFLTCKHFWNLGVGEVKVNQGGRVDEGGGGEAAEGVVGEVEGLEGAGRQGGSELMKFVTTEVERNKARGEAAEGGEGEGGDVVEI